MAALTGQYSSPFGNNFKAYVISSVNNSSVVIKSAIVSVISCYLLALIPSVQKVLLMAPGRLIPPNFSLWMLVTAGLTENSIVKVIIDIAVLLTAGKLIEPSWGALEFLKFIGLINATVTGGAAMTYIIAYAISKRSAYLFTGFGGLIGTTFALSVALKQSYSEVKIIPLRTSSVRAKHVPIILICIVASLSLLKVLNMSDLCMAFFGFLNGWIYLRFLQKKANESKGDFSDGFAFATFFPEVIQPPIKWFSNSLFLLLISMKICPKQVRRYNVGGPSSVTISLPGIDPADAERRKQLALKELDKRLSGVDQSGSWPSLDEPGGESHVEEATTGGTITVNEVNSEGIKEESTDIV
ncbi:Transmembrane protein 115 [Trichoplax sp. H2]|nr:Transmembrane protein 115 [Trichoplax sp. H2]|eukprot:RDD43457.1 Transmembrane protein 115 [Trichoplax sp. H2]